MKPRFILFTGHRDKKAAIEDIEMIYVKYPDSIWIHGGAIGFDSLVDDIAEKCGIQRIILPPPYQHSQDKSAPLKRNDLMLELCDAVVTLYDGRTSGGTYYTIKQAKKLNKPVKYLKPK